MKDNIIPFNNGKETEKTEKDLMEEMARFVSDLLRIPITQRAHKIENDELRETTLDFIKASEKVEKILKNLDELNMSEKDKKDFFSAIGLYHMSLGSLVHPLMEADLQKRGGVN